MSPLFAPDTFLATAKRLTSKGVVFRVVKDVRKPGVLNKKEDKWVWKEKTFSELNWDYGITGLTPIMLHPEIHMLQMA